MKKITSLPLLLLFLSCSNNSLVNNKSGSPVDLGKNEIHVNMDENTVNGYNLLSTLYNGEDFAVAYNSYTHSVDVINITKDTVSHIVLDSEGPDGITHTVSGIYAHTLDSIWVSTVENIVLVDSAGHVKRRVSLLRKEGEVSLTITNFSIGTSKIYYNSKRNSLFSLMMSVSSDKAGFFVEEYSLLNGSIKKYPVTMVVEKNLRYSYGWKQCPNVTFTDTKILYNFPIESNVYVIDVETGNNMVYGGKSQYTNNEVGPLNFPYDFEKANRHIIENVHFFELNYDPVNDVYYRLHLNRTGSDVTRDFEDIYNCREMYLTVFNSEFEVINESKLDNFTYNYRNCWGILSKGLFIAKSNFHRKDINHEQFEMDVYRVAVKK
jgi:hypothetical protein